MQKPKPDKIVRATIDRVPYSSVVGSSLKIVAKGVGVVAILPILVPQTHLDYKITAEAVMGAILNGHVSRNGVTLVLPDGFGILPTPVPPGHRTGGVETER